MADIKIGDIAVYEDDDGKAVWEFEGKVQSDIPLDTDAQDFAGAINELKKLSEMGGGEGYLRAVIDDDASSLTIIAGNGAEDEAHGVFNYTYETLEISDEIKMQITSGGVVTTNTKKFSAKLISKLYNYDGELIFRAECSSKGKIKGFYDGSGKELHSKHFELNRGENIGISGADAPAIAWCMAKNSERSDAFNSQKKSYREGMDDSGADAVEDYNEEGAAPIEIVQDKNNPDSKSSEPCYSGLDMGFVYTVSDSGGEAAEYQLKVYSTSDSGRCSSSDGTVGGTYKGQLCYDIYDMDGNLITNGTFGGNGMSRNIVFPRDTLYAKYQGITWNWYKWEGEYVTNINIGGVYTAGKTKYLRWAVTSTGWSESIGSSKDRQEIRYGYFPIKVTDKTTVLNTSNRVVTAN